MKVIIQIVWKQNDIYPPHKQPDYGRTNTALAPAMRAAGKYRFSKIRTVKKKSGVGIEKMKREATTCFWLTYRRGGMYARNMGK